MIVAGEMLNITNRNKNNTHDVGVEQIILDAACRGEYSISYPELPQDKQLELLRAGYRIDFNSDKGKIVSYISWRNAHD